MIEKKLHFLYFSLNIFQFQLTGVPATSPGSTGSGSNLSPSCGGEPGPALSPLSSSRAGSGMAGDPMAGQILSDSSHLAALSGQNCLQPPVFIPPNSSNDPKRQKFPRKILMFPLEESPLTSEV